jgi:shikimate dehydrogenase
MNRLAVLGQPIAHSLSPAMHTAAFRALGMDGEWSYEAIELSPGEFEGGVGELRERGFVGANVTVPHKEAALALSERSSDAAAAIGAANTLSFTADGVAADNTDAPGLIASLPEDPRGRRALVLGAGGAARAAIWALAGAGAEVSVHNRTEARARAVAEELGASVMPDSGRQLPVEEFEIVVNATSIGLAGGLPPAQAPLDALKGLGVAADRFSDRQIVVDLVYGTIPTELIQAARSAGATVVDGLEILIRQGAESFRIWTGTEAPVEAMRAAIEKSSDGHA